MIVPATDNDYPSIIEVWELSVRATHHFLSEDYLQQIKVLLPSILRQVRVYTWREEDGTIQGFAGVAENKMEMLFIHPNSRGKGLGRLLAEFCIHTLKAPKVDVNEDNSQAIAFYKRIGYRQTGRRELDSMGRPFPLLEMQFTDETFNG